MSAAWLCDRYVRAQWEADMAVFGRRASADPPLVREFRRRAFDRLCQRLLRQQRERELVDLGYRDLGGEG